MIKLQKKIFLIVCFFLFSSFHLCSQSKEPLTVLSKTLNKKDKNCTYSVKYPILKLGKNSPHNVEYIKSIGKTLIDDFTKLDSYENEYDCNKNDKNAPPFSLDGGFDVKLLNDSILSIYSSFSSFTEGNAHPHNIYKTYNFDLKTGKQIPFENLFRKDSKFLIPLHKYMAESLVKDKTINDKEEFISAKKSKYDYYLSPQGIHIINLFDIYAIQSAEVLIPYEKMKKYLDTENTFKFIP